MTRLSIYSDEVSNLIFKFCFYLRLKVPLITMTKTLSDSAEEFLVRRCTALKCVKIGKSQMFSFSVVSLKILWRICVLFYIINQRPQNVKISSKFFPRP